MTPEYLGSETGSNDALKERQPAGTACDQGKIACLVLLPHNQEFIMVKACPGTSLSASEDARVIDWKQIMTEKGKTPEHYRKVIEDALQDHTGIEISFDSIEIMTGSTKDANNLRELLGLSVDNDKVIVNLSIRLGYKPTTDGWSLPKKLLVSTPFVYFMFKYIVEALDQGRQ
ncbi:hypothetical protein NCC49_001938 [Naganishia albida]|nr:hypothetical protein NCC49_001938 [Naganishia albida]